MRRPDRTDRPSWKNPYYEDPERSPISAGLIATLLALTFLGGAVVVAVKSNPANTSALAFEATAIHREQPDEPQFAAAQASAPPAHQRSAAEAGAGSAE
jgi:hypothetical protein